MNSLHFQLRLAMQGTNTSEPKTKGLALYRIGNKMTEYKK